MKRIPLTCGLFTLVDDWNFGRLDQWAWYALKSGPRYYAARDVRKGGRRKTILMHRLIMGAPRGLDVDHRNGDTLDNREQFLRIASRSSNIANSGPRSNNTSGFKGVSWDSLREQWTARIMVRPTYKFLGRFDSPTEAAHAYDAAAQKYFGEFAFANFPITAKQKL